MDLRWSLDELYTSFESEEFKRDFADFKKTVAEINGWAEKNLKDADNPIEKIEWYIHKTNELSKFYKLHSFAHLTESVDASNETAIKYIDLINNELTNLAKPDVMFNKFIGGITDLSGLIEKSALLGEHGFLLKKLREQFKYLLSESEEVIIAKLQTTGSDAWESMKNQLVSTVMFDIELNGEKKSLPYAAIRNLAYDGNQQTRKSAYYAELEGYKKIDRAVAAALNGIKGEVLTVSKMRGYESPLEMTLKKSRMEKETLDAMLDAVSGFLPSLRRFYRKKAELLGHTGGLPFYDLFAPVGSVNMRFSYDEAAGYIVEHFSSFNKKLGDYAKTAFENGWIDAEPREGKRGGAFCSGIHSLKQSRILANFEGSFNDVVTLAHELGHGYHNQCIQDATYLNSDYPMPIAETASTFCETIVCNAALAAANGEERFAILQNQISDMLQVIVDIYSRFVFETNLFKEREHGPLSVKELNLLMLDAQKLAYGDGLDHNFLHEYMWLGKPHYYYAGYNFYNFPYAYGLMFSMGLYSEYLKTGEAFVRKYDELLAAAGTDSLEGIGRLAGINVTDKEFWISSLKIIDNKIDEFCGW